MTDDETPAELAAHIMDADRPSTPIEQRLRFQWNVPLGVTPYVPLWLALVFLGLIVLAIGSAVLG